MWRVGCWDSVKGSGGYYVHRNVRIGAHPTFKMQMTEQADHKWFHARLERHLLKMFHSDGSSKTFNNAGSDWSSMSDF